MGAIGQDPRWPRTSANRARLDQNFEVWQGTVRLSDFDEKRQQRVVLEKKVADRFGTGNAGSSNDQGAATALYIRQKSEYAECAVPRIGRSNRELGRLPG